MERGAGWNGVDLTMKQPFFLLFSFAIMFETLNPNAGTKNFGNISFGFGVIEKNCNFDTKKSFFDHSLNQYFATKIC